MGRRKKGKTTAADALATAAFPSAPHLDRGQLADCLSQTSKIAAECNSILRDLLRGRSPQHQDLQRLASQVLMGQSLGLTDLQRKMESQQATLAELLKMLKPAAGAAALGLPMGADGDDASAVLATYAAHQPSLSIVKGWDALSLLAAPMRRRKGQKVDRRQEGTGAAGNKRERCFGVEAFWRQLDPAQRRKLLRAPLAKMAEAVRAEQGEEGVRDLAEALALLRQQGGRCSAYWRCPCCDTRMLDAAAFVHHVQLYHEEVQYTAAGAAVQCTKCLKEVVGAHYQNEEPGFPTVVLCMTCCWDEQILQATGFRDRGCLSAGGDDSGSAMQLRMPQPGQRLLPAVAGGEGGEPWSWLGSGGRHGSSGRKADGSSTEGSSTEGSSSSEEEDSSEGDEGGGEGGGGGGEGQRRRRRRRRRHGGTRSVSIQQEMRLEQQMATQVRACGGLLAAVAQRLDVLAQEARAPAASASHNAPSGSSNGGGGGAPRVPFEQTLLALVAQAQQLLSMPGGGDGEAVMEGTGRLEMQIALSAPEAFPDQEKHLQDSLSHLTSKELQCLLGYAITKHGSALGPGSGPAGVELLSSSAAAAAAAGVGYADSGSDSGSCGGASSASSSSGSDEFGSTPDLGSPVAGSGPAGSGTGGLVHAGGSGGPRRRQRHGSHAAHVQPPSYDPGCASIFGFSRVAGDGAAPALLLEGDSNGSTSGGDGNDAASGNGGPSLLCQQLAALQAQPGSLLAELPEGRGLSGRECLEPHPFWVDHLSHKSWHDFPGDGGAEVYLLQWVYGNVAHAPTEDFLERQRLAAGAKGCDNAVMDCLAELADVWRQLAAATTRKRHLQSLRDGVREEAAAVRSFEEAGAAALRTQAAEFFDEVGGSGSPRSGSSGGMQWSQRALGKLQRFHQLKDESSIRYAQALIDREVAVLELAEEMDLHELSLAGAEVQSIEAALGDAQRGLGEAEAERTQLSAEGPPLHRKKDLLDKVNKEAEHWGLLQELQQRIAAGQERICSEEGFLADARKRHEELTADLREVRAEMASFLERRAALDRACHDVLTAQERDRDQQLTDAHVDQRIRAVWQVVTCVADAIRLLPDRYAPDSQSREAERHIRCTGQAQGLCDDTDERASALWNDLERLRRLAVDLACCDASLVVEAAALEVIRTQLEDAAVAAREAATLDLLRELELEEAAKKATEVKKGKKKKKGGRAVEEGEETEEEVAAAAEGKKGKKKKKKGGRVVEEGEETPEEAAAAGAAPGIALAAAAGAGGSSRSSSAASGAGAAARGGAGSKGGGGGNGGSGSGNGPGAVTEVAAAAQQLLSSLEQMAPETRADLEYEAALEQRRQELDAERRRQEQEMMRMAQEASLREAQQQASTPAAAAAGGKGSKAAAGATAARGGSGNGNGSAKGGSSGGAAAVAGSSPAAAGAAGGLGGKSPKKGAAAVAAAPAGGSRSAPGTPGKVKAAGAAAAASTGGRVITVAVAAVRGGSGRLAQPTSPPPPPPPSCSKSPAKPAAAAANTGHAAAATGAVPSGGASGTGTAGGGSGSSAQHGKSEMRVISYYGDWRCSCGVTNRLWDTCVCGQIPPCRDWVRGRCTYKTRCRFAHPPFELPDSMPRPKSPIAKPSPEALQYSKGGASGTNRTGTASGKASNGPQAVTTPDAPAVVSAPRVVAVTASGKGGTGGRTVQLVKPGGRPGSSVPKPAAPPAGKAAGPAAAEAAPPPPLKPAPWAKLAAGAAAAAPPPPAAAAAASPEASAAPALAQHSSLPAAPASAAAAAASAAAGGFVASQGPSAFSLFGGSNPLMSALGGGGGGSSGRVSANELLLGSLSPEPASLLDAGGGLGAFGGSDSLFGPGMFGQGGAESQHLLMQQQQQQQQDSFAAAQHAQLAQQAQHMQQMPMSPGQLSSHLSRHSSMPQSPLMLSPQPPRLPLGPHSPSGPPPSLPFHSSGLGSPLGELPLGVSSPAAGGERGLDLPGLAAFQHHFHQAGAPFSNSGPTGGLPFAGGSLLGGFGGLGPHSGGGFGMGLGVGVSGTTSSTISGTASRMEDWSDLQQQLPSDLGAMLGSDPLLQQHSPHLSPLKPAPPPAGPDAGSGSGALYGGAAAHWF